MRPFHEVSWLTATPPRSFIDVLISFPLGCLLIAVQLIAAKNDLYSNIFEISVSALFSFIAAALSSSGYFCYTAVASSSIVLILPGYIVLSGSLELACKLNWGPGA